MKVREDSNMSTELEKKKNLPNKRGNYIAELVFDIIFLVIANGAPVWWNLSFLTDQYPTLLRIINITIGIQASGRLMLIMYRPLPLHYITEVVFSGIGFYLAYSLFTIFPFDFTSLGGAVGEAVSFFPFRIVLKIIFGIAMGANIIKGIVNIVKFAVSISKES